MERVVDLSVILAEAPRNRWLALNEEQTAVVAVGKTLREALEKAKENGFPDPIIMWAPPVWLPSAYSGGV